MLSWPGGSYSAIPKMQVRPCPLWQVLNLCAKRRDFAAVSKPALSLFKEVGWAVGFVAWRITERVFSVILGHLLFPSLLMSVWSGLPGNFYCLRMAVWLILIGKGSGCSPKKHIPLLSWIRASEPWFIIFSPIQRQILSSYHSRNLSDELSNHDMFWFGFFQIKTLPFRKRKP